MTNEEQKLREIAYKHAEPKVIWSGGNMSVCPDEEKIESLLSDLTALISEGYVSKKEHEPIAKMAEALKVDMDAAKLELALIRKFILWTGENCQYYPDVNEWMYFESPMTQQYFKGTDELFNYWRENENV